MASQRRLLQAVQQDSERRVIHALVYHGSRCSQSAGDSPTAAPTSRYPQPNLSRRTNTARSAVVDRLSRIDAKSSAER